MGSKASPDTIDSPPQRNSCFSRSVKPTRVSSRRVFRLVASVVCVSTFSGIGTCQSVSGTVRDGKGKAVHGAEIVVERPTGRINLKTNSIGAYSSNAGPGGGRVRISVTAKGLAPVEVEATVPDRTPSCKADLTLYKAGRQRGDHSPGGLSCSEPLPPPPPYAGMLSFDAKINCAPPVTRCQNMQLFGRYALQTTPSVRQPVAVHVAAAPANASWSLSAHDVASLIKTGPQDAQVEFAADGDVDLTLLLEGRALLRIRMRARTFENGWQVLADRVTEKGEVIDAAGNVVK